MATRGTGSALFDDAIELLREADRMHRQFFTLALSRTGPCWEPPVDVVERNGMIVIRIALPGVRAEAIEVRSEAGSLHVSARRAPGADLGSTIHQLEIPYGRFERRIELPAGSYEIVQRDLVDGCLVIALRRLG